MVENLSLLISAREDVPGFRDRSISHLVSIGELDPNNPLAEGWSTKPQIYRFEFDDVLSDKGRPTIYQPPSDSDVLGLLKVAKAISGQLSLGHKVNLLVHCSMGVSRSSAAAFVILNALAGTGREEACMEAICKVRPMACPNYLVVQIGDRLLERNGAMLEAVKRHISRQWGPGSRWGPNQDAGGKQG
jgi:predicted protein tyrosine phosphatase